MEPLQGLTGGPQAALGARRPDQSMPHHCFSTLASPSFPLLPSLARLLVAAGVCTKCGVNDYHFDCITSFLVEKSSAHTNSVLRKKLKVRTKFGLGWVPPACRSCSASKGWQTYQRRAALCM